jgi:hypothetical protein
MNLNADLQTAVAAKWAGTAWLVANVAGGLHYDDAPKGTSYPHVVFYLEASTDRVFGGSMHDYDLQFNVFSKTSDSDQVNDIVEAIKGAFEAATLAMTGGHVVLSKPALQNEHVYKNESKNWQGVLIFALSAR